MPMANFHNQTTNSAEIDTVFFFLPVDALDGIATLCEETLAGTQREILALAGST